MSFGYTINHKTINEDGFIQEIDTAGLSHLFSHISRFMSVYTVHFTQELFGSELATYTALVEAHDPTPHALKKYVQTAVSEAIGFGYYLISEFGAENTLSGIEQAGMTRTVRLITADVAAALSSGALLDAIAAMREISPDDYDGVFVTEAKLLRYINKCEVYMGMPKSTEV